MPARAGAAYIPNPAHKVQYNGSVWHEMEMLTPKGEHFFPCSTRVMFDGRISFDGIATAKTL
jgi:hypothetical protein